MSIKFIFFDIDQTLIDYSDAVSKATTYFIQEEPFFGTISSSDFNAVWSTLRTLYTQPKLDGKVSLNELRIERMKILIKHFGLTLSSSEVERLTFKFFKLCEISCRAFPDVKPVLNKLVAYRFGVITNGKESIQRKKLANASLSYSFSPFIASVDYQCAKPSQKIFKFALKEAKDTPNHCLMIGDNLKLDILPAKRLGFKAIFLNRKGKENQGYQVTQIKNLYELQKFL